MANGIAVLMYHELEVPGRPLCQADPGYRRYVVSGSAFRSHLAHLKSLGYQGISSGDALEGIQGRQVVLTFDDGSETDLKVAAPLLASVGFRATFYVTAGFLGLPGFMTEQQLRELSAGGFEIGCHSLTHPYLTELDSGGLHREIVEAKEKLEQVVGHAVKHFSCPGGRFDDRVVAKVKDAGYSSMANSEPRMYSGEGSPYSIGRSAILREASSAQIERICEGRGLWRHAVGQKVRFGIQRVLGNRLYDSVRASLLSRTD